MSLQRRMSDMFSMSPSKKTNTNNEKVSSSSPVTMKQVNQSHNELKKSITSSDIDEHNWSDSEKDSSFYDLNLLATKSNIDGKPIFCLKAENEEISYFVSLLKHKDHFTEFIKENIDLADDFDNYSPLMFAARNGNHKICKILLQLDASINFQGGWNLSTALLKAVERRQIQVIEVLLSYKPKVDMPNTFLSTPLMVACERGFADCTQLLLQAEASTVAKNRDDYTSLILAAEQGHLECVKLIAEHPQTVLDEPNKFGKNALMMASENGHIECIRYLITKNPMIEFKSKRGATAIMLASMKGHYEVVKLLASLSNIRQRTIDSKENALHLATQNGFLNIIELLIEADRVSHEVTHSKHSKKTKSIMEELGPDGNTLLMIACQYGKLHVLDYFLSLFNSREVTRQLLILNEKKEDVFKLACIGGHLDVFARLLSISSPHIRQRVISDKRLLKIISDYYLSQPHKFNDFCRIASKNYDSHFLFDLLLDILPSFPSPISVLSTCHLVLIDGLQQQSGYGSDKSIVCSLMLYCIALKKCVILPQHTNESKELNELIIEVEGMLTRTLSCISMTKSDNVLQVLSGKSFIEGQYDTYAKYMADIFTNGLIVKYARHDLTALLETAQVSRILDTIFSKSTQPRVLRNVESSQDFFMLRGNCFSIRRTPLMIFYLEGIFKSILLVLLSILLAFCYSKESIEYYKSHCLNSLQGHSPNTIELVVILIVITRLCHFIGEMIHNHYDEVISEEDNHEYFRFDHWNGFDIIGVFFMLLWSLFKFNIFYSLLTLVGIDNLHYWEHRLLALSCISVFIGMLKFTLLHQQLGQLTIMVFRVVSDLKWISIFFLSSIFVFSIPFASLFPMIFDTFTKAFSNLFSASLGESDLDFDDIIGQILFYVFVVLEHVVLFNLILARLSSSHEEIVRNAWGKRALLRTRLLREYLQYANHNVLCMLPSPLNAIALIYFLMIRFFYNLSFRQAQLHAGDFSDIILSIILSPIYAHYEVEKAILAIEYEGLSKQDICYHTSLISYLWIYCYYLQKICHESYNAHNPLKNTCKNSFRVTNQFDFSHDIAKELLRRRLRSPDSNFDIHRLPNTNDNTSTSTSTSTSIAGLISLDYNSNHMVTNIFGQFKLQIIRLKDLLHTSRIYHAKMRFFVRIVFNSQVYTTCISCIRSNESKNVEIHDHVLLDVITNESTKITISVYDSYASVFPDKLIGSYSGSIKEWIANGRFEGDLPIFNNDLLQGKLQINVRMNYDVPSSHPTIDKYMTELYTPEDRIRIFKNN